MVTELSEREKRVMGAAETERQRFLGEEREEKKKGGRDPYPRMGPRNLYHIHNHNYTSSLSLLHTINYTNKSAGVLK